MNAAYGQPWSRRPCESFFRALMLGLAVTTASCGDSRRSGGSGGESGEGYSGSLGWISISQQSYTTSEPTASLSGHAFMSPEGSDYTTSRTPPHPGVTVSWRNETSGVGGAAGHRVVLDWCGPTTTSANACSWSHVWEASVPLLPGENVITVTATDSRGNAGKTGLVVVYHELTPPLVRSTFPYQSDCVRFEPTGPIRVEFNEAMDPASISTATLSLADDLGNRVRGSVTYADSVATFWPASDLRPATSYRGMVSTDAKDVAGNRFANEYSWTFTTRDGTAPPPPCKFAYVANFDSNNVSAYSINTTTGTLTPVSGSPFAAGTNPVAVGVDPSGRFAYVANMGSNDVSAYSIVPSTGALVPVTGSPFAAGASPVSIGVDPYGRFVYVTNAASNDISAYAIDPGAGALVPLHFRGAATGKTPQGIKIDPSGRYVYVANFYSNDVYAYTINASTGQLAAVPGSPFAAGTNPISAAVDPSGNFLYVTNNGSSSVSGYQIDSSTGTLYPHWLPFAAGRNPRSIAIDASAKFAYVANAGSNDVYAYALDPGGPLTLLGIFSAGLFPESVSVESSGRFVYIANHATNNVSAYAIEGVGEASGSPGQPFPAGASPISIATVDIPQ